MRFLLLSILFLKILSGAAFANDRVLYLNEETDFQSAGTYLHYIEDQTGSLDINTLKDPSENSLWKTNDEKVPNFGYTDSVYWYRLHLANPLDKSLSRFIEIGYPLLDHIHVFVYQNGMLIDHFETGDRVPFSHRPVKNRNFLFPIKVLPHQKLNIYFRINTSGSMQVPMNIWKKQPFFIADQSDIIRKSLFYGVLSVMILYNLFLFFSLREPAYLYYVLFVTAFLETQAAMNGFLFEYVWPSSPRIQDLGILAGVPANVLFTSLFANNFLNLKRNAPKMSRFFSIGAFLGGLSLIGAFFLPYDISTRISVFLVVPGV